MLWGVQRSFASTKTYYAIKRPSKLIISLGLWEAYGLIISLGLWDLWAYNEPPRTKQTLSSKAQCTVWWVVVRPVAHTVSSLYRRPNGRLSLDITHYSIKNYQALALCQLLVVPKRPILFYIVTCYNERYVPSCLHLSRHCEFTCSIKYYHKFRWMYASIS